MNKQRFFILVALVVLGIVAGFYTFNGYIYEQKQAPSDYKDLTFLIGKDPVTLVDGISEVEAAPGSASKTITRYFGNEAKGDLNGDGIVDLAFLITQETGGSGTFFYVVGAIQDASNRYQGTSAVLLGDRIAPQTTEIQGGKLIVNYAERRADEPMTAQPSIGKSIYLKLDPVSMQFGEIVQDFEGEADPKMMKLTMKSWVWVKSNYNDGREVFPKQPGRFSITLKEDGSFTATTDCNSAGGKWAEKAGGVSFQDIFSTKMFCEGSQESVFTTDLGNVSDYHFTSKGELILSIKFDSGTMTFK